MSPGGAWQQAKSGTCSSASSEVVPEAQPGPLQQYWPELGKPKVAEAAVRRRITRGDCTGAADALFMADEADDATKADDAEEDNEEEDVEDGEGRTEMPSRRPRRRRRHRRSSGSSQAAATESSLSAHGPELFGTSASEDEAAGLQARNVVTWNDLLGQDHELKPESPSGGFQCATAACWGRFAQHQLQYQQSQPETPLRLEQQQQAILPASPPQQPQQPAPAQTQPWEQQEPFVLLQPTYYDSCSSKVVALMPASFGTGVQWIITDVPSPDWSPSHHAEELRTWLCDSMQRGSVPLSELDLVLQSLASDTYED